MSGRNDRVIGDEELRMIVQYLPEFKLLELKELKESSGTWGLGHFTLYRKRPSFRWGYTFSLQPGSRMRKARLDFPDLDVDAFAAIFRQRDNPEEPELSPEYFCGWVTVDREAELDGWIEFLNGEVARLLAAHPKS